MKELLQFVQKAECFDNNDRLKLVLFLSGVKPSTFIHLRITSKNLHDKHEFEDLLRKKRILFEVSRAKGFEEITAVKGNAAVWRLKGQWYGYDLFRNKEFRDKFSKYVSLVKQQKHDQADRTAGIIYGYPTCCIDAFIKQHKTTAASYYAYYKKLQDCDRKFPFVAHTPCSQKCKSTEALNRIYEGRVKNLTPEFYKKFAKKRTYKAKLIVDSENEIKAKKKDGHYYVVATQRPVEGHYYLFNVLSRKKYPRGTMLDATITLQYDYAIITVKKETGKIKGFHHERKFAKL
jgi:hypothetical protein